jgi:hypothetical protein
MTNKITCIVAFALVFSSPALMADQMTVSIDGFGAPGGGFSITETSDLSLLVSELVPADGTNQSTHILIESLSPLEPDTLNFASPYSGINVNTGATQDVGVLYLQMPSGSTLPEGTVASPIVGVVERAGSWMDLTFPETTVGGSSGPGTYASGTIDLSLTKGLEQFNGAVAYTVVDEDTIDLEPFSITKSGPVTYDLSGTTLLRDGSRFYGTVTNLSAGAAYESLLFEIQFTGIPDADMYGIPDISDSEIGGGLVVGQWSMTSLGYMYGSNADWGYSYFLGFLDMNLPWVYQASFGWMYFYDAVPSEGAYWFYSPTIGWIYVKGNGGGKFQTNDGGGGGWISNNFLKPRPM